MGWVDNLRKMVTVDRKQKALRSGKMRRRKVRHKEKVRHMGNKGTIDHRSGIEKP